MAQLDALEQHPERCSLAAESEDLGEEFRELLLGRRRYKYRLVFRIKGRTVGILRGLAQFAGNAHARGTLIKERQTP